MWARLPVTHILFFLATLVTTTVCGVFLLNVNLFQEPWKFYQGFPFSLTLLTILGTHEFGHYWMARYHGVPVTLPYFIPAPPLLIGTFGAFIRIKGIVPNRGALFDIGVAGPIAGFAVAVPAIILGITLSEVRPAAELSGIGLGSSLLFNGLIQVFLGVTPQAYDVLLHPIAFAGWIGFLVTAFNLHSRQPVGWGTYRLLIVWPLASAGDATLRSGATPHGVVLARLVGMGLCHLLLFRTSTPPGVTDGVLPSATRPCEMRWCHCRPPRNG